MIDLPVRVRRTAESRGESGRAWLARLPVLVAELAEQWSLTMTGVLTGGSAAYVARARRADGTEAVLKVALSGEGFAEQAATLRAADGHGYARLYAYDGERNAMLMEALGARLDPTFHGAQNTVDILAAMLEQAWQVPPWTARPLRPGKAEQLIELIEGLWPKLGRPCERRVIDRALDYAANRVGAPAEVVCHGDPHPANALAVRQPRPGAESGYVFVDPDGFRADRAYDLGVTVREWTDRVHQVAGFCTRLAERTGVDRQAIWEWGFVERVSTGLYLMDHGHAGEGRDYLRSAEELAAA